MNSNDPNLIKEVNGKVLNNFEGIPAFPKEVEKQEELDLGDKEEK